MPSATTPSRAELRRDLWLSLTLTVFALLFIVIYIVFLTSFGGEFLIVIKGSWILPPFLILIVGGAAAALALSILSLRQGVVRECRASRPGRPAGARPG